MDSDKRRTAIHEAGHAVIGRVLGLVSGEVTIAPDRDEDIAGISKIADPWDTIDEWDVRLESVRNHAFETGDFTGLKNARVRTKASAFRGTIIARMAGAEAEEVILGACDGGDGSDRREIAWMMQSRDAEIPPDRCELWEARMRRQTRRLIRRHRDKIERVAEALMSRQTLQTEEVDAIIG